MQPSDSAVRELLRRISDGDTTAVQELIEPHRKRLRRMVSARMSNEILSRCDPSDVVQETMAEASRRLSRGREANCIPFYPWLRQIAFDRLVDLHRRHVTALRRSVRREAQGLLPLSSASEAAFADQWLAPGSSPSEHLLRQELRQRMHELLGRLSSGDREVLVLRHLEQLSIQEIAAVLQLTEAATQSRYRRAVERMHALLTNSN